MTTRRFLLGIWCITSASIALTGNAAAQQLPFGDGTPVTTPPHLVCAYAARDEPARKRCRVEDLSLVDARLNARFAELKQLLPPPELVNLTSAQRRWLEERDATCQLNRKTRKREDWYAYVADWDQRTDCVKRFTDKRIAELNSIRIRLDRSSTVVTVTPRVPDLAYSSGVVLPGERAREADFLRRSMTARTMGKHYFEVVIDEARAGHKTSSVIARISGPRQWSGTVLEMRSREWVLRTGPDSTRLSTGQSVGGVSVPKQVVGLAFDLDSRRVYLHRDGEWFANASPGSERGVKFEHDGPFTAEVRTGIPLSELVDTWILSVNFGHKPFEYKPPDGYRGFDWQDKPESATEEPAAGMAYAVTERVAGDVHWKWLQKYWEWIRTFPAGKTPIDDPTGIQCTDGQSGPVWFLSGSGKSDLVHRRCQVPHGKVMLLPFLNVLVEGDSKASCARLLELLRPFGASASDLQLKINNEEVVEPKPVLVETGCFPLLDTATGAVGLAAGTGHWMFLRPLRRGTHLVEFRGRYIADGFTQDIRYELDVR
jgi:uncharacterized protein YecT (DUF1311 family)